jgi:SAM-dependent methyltransferase
MGRINKKAVEIFKSDPNHVISKEWIKTLQYQVDLFAAKEIKIMSRLGLGSGGRPMLDLGCGIGAFSKALRKHFPSQKIVATDNNEAFVTIFRNKLLSDPDPLTELIKWDTMNEATPPAVRKCHTVVMRLVLEYIKDPVAMLLHLKQCLPPRSLIFIIEEDDYFFQIHPDLDALWKVVKTWGLARERLDFKKYFGRQVPCVATNAGLKVLHAELIGHTNFDSDLREMFDYFVATMHLLHNHLPREIDPKEISQMERQFREYVAQNGNNCLLIVPYILTVAQTP